MQKRSFGRKVLTRKTKHALSKIFLSEPTIFPKVRAASYFDIDIDILLDDVLVCTRITTEEAMITDTINVQQMLYIFLYSFSRSENLEFLTQWYWVV